MRYGLGAAYLRQPPPQYGRWSSDGAAMTGPLPAVPSAHIRLSQGRPLLSVTGEMASRSAFGRNIVMPCRDSFSRLPTCPGNLVEMDM